MDTTLKDSKEDCVENEIVDSRKTVKLKKKGKAKTILIGVMLVGGTAYILSLLAKNAKLVVENQEIFGKLVTSEQRVRDLELDYVSLWGKYIELASDALRNRSSLGGEVMNSLRQAA